MTEGSAYQGVLLVKSGGSAAVPDWQAQFAKVCPGLDVRDWNDTTVDPGSVAYVLVWEPDPGRLATYPNLRVIFSSAAGVDHLTRDTDLPRHVPIVRMGAGEAGQTMGEYVCLAALALLRDYRRLVDAQAQSRWDPFEGARTAPQTRIGILGFGNLGRRAAAMLRGLGFPVAGWARTPRDEPPAWMRCPASWPRPTSWWACCPTRPKPPA
jgi:glyoxylate/hydroxypyruvate reductase A